MAVTDVFHRRYTEPLWRGRGLPDGYIPFFRQVADILWRDVGPRLQRPDLYFTEVHDRLARELATGHLAQASDAVGAILSFLGDVGPLEHEMSPDHFAKTRLSLVEIALAELEPIVRQAEAPPIDARTVPHPVAMFASGPERPWAWSTEALPLRDAIDEINERFRLNSLPFHYHNGAIQLADDDLVTDHIDKPFWKLTSDPRWSSVDREMREALDRRDHNMGDASFHALKALESALKVLSDDRGLTTGREKGAANFVENLSSKRGRGFIAKWEAEQLRALFATLRNPQGHGAGSVPPLTLAASQTDFVIESAMSWIKSLITRP